MNELTALLPGLGFMPQPLTPPAQPQAGASADAFIALFTAAMQRTPVAPAQPEATPARIEGDVAWPTAEPAADDPVDAVITRLTGQLLREPAKPAISIDAPRALVDAVALPVTTPATNALGALEPAFRAPLQRVLERMTQLGYQVEVVETYRSPERQQYLYEQGRSRPGPVVTWTRTSRHSEGLATDVRIVDAAAKPQAYQDLARIASEEGLRTLGPADPGHIELPRTDAPTGTRNGATPAATRSDESTRRIFEIARAAGRVAPVAQDVAAYARELVTDAFRAARTPQVVEQPVSQKTTQSLSRQTTQPMPRPAVHPVQRPGMQPVTLPTARAATDEAIPAANPVEREPPTVKTSPAAEPVTPAAPTHQQTPQPQVQAQPEPQVRQAEPATPVRETSPTVPTDTLRQRVERVVALQEASAAQPAHTVSLRLNDANDNSARVIVALRGNEVNADVRVSDPAVARELTEALPQLKRSLERHGLTAAWSEPTPAATLNTVAATPRSGAGTMQQQDRREQEYVSRDGTHEQRQSPRRERERRPQGGDER